MLGSSSSVDNNRIGAEAEDTVPKGHVRRGPTGQRPIGWSCLVFSQNFLWSGDRRWWLCGAWTANTSSPPSGPCQKAVQPQEVTFLPSDRNPPGTNIATHQLLFQISIWEKAMCTRVQAGTHTHTHTSKNNKNVATTDLALYQTNVHTKTEFEKIYTGHS